MEILKMTHNLTYYLKLFDTRKQNGDMFGALDAGRNALKFAKTRIDKDSINTLLGNIYFEMGLYKLSCEYYFRAISVPSTRAGAYFGVARNLIFMHRYNQSLDYFDKVLEWDNSGLFSEAVLEWTNFINKKIKEAENQQPFEVLKNTAKKFLQFGDCVNAQKNLDEVLALCPEDDEALLLYAQCLFGIGQVDKSRQIIKTVLKDNPHNTNARLLLCDVCLHDEDFTSLGELLKTVDLSQLNDAQLLCVSKIFAKVCDFESAISALLKLVEIRPYSPKVYLYLAICHHNTKDSENSLYFLAQARWLDFENPVLVEYSRVFATTQDVLPMIDKLPTQHEQEKLQKLHGQIIQPKFVDNWLHSPMLVDETDWLLGTSFFDEGEMLCHKLSLSRAGKAKRYYAKVLLSVRPNLKQKFFLTREALRAQKFKTIDLTANFCYRSFSSKLPKICSAVDLFKNSLTSAWAYIECFANNANITKRAKQLCELILTKNMQNSIDEDVLTCLMFCDNYAEMLRACRYFDVDVASIENAKNMLNIM